MKSSAVCSGSSLCWRKGCLLFLASFWCTGLILGVYAASLTDNILPSLMRSAVYSPVSIVGLLGVYLLPFLFTAIAVFLSKSWLILPICFYKSFSYGMCAHAVTLTFGNSGWLLQLLFLFSDTVMLFLLCWFWIRHIAGMRVSVVRDATICIVVFIILGILDCCCVSPFLAMLINN